MNSLLLFNQQSKQQQLLVSLLIVLFLLVAQGASAQHDVEHHSHHNQQLCNGFIQYHSCHALSAYIAPALLFSVAEIFDDNQVCIANVYRVERAGQTRAPPVSIS